jgi:hypothetical protein
MPMKDFSKSGKSEYSISKREVHLYLAPFNGKLNVLFSKLVQKAQSALQVLPKSIMNYFWETTGQYYI